MRNSILSFMAAALCVVAAGAQVSIPDTDVSAGSTKPAGSSSVAYIYVSSMIGNSSTAEIIGFSAAANGELTPIPGSPFAGDVGNLAGNGNYLFGSTLSTTDIESYAIEPNGALRFAGSTNVVTPNGGCGNAESITLDHTGASLYDVSYFGNDCTNNTYETFSINNSNGKLTFLGDAGSTEFIEGPLTFIGNNEYAYTTDCYHFDGGITPFKRSKNGKLTQLNFEVPFPALSTGSYCGLGQAADPTNHVAIAMQAFDGINSPVTGVQLGTYTVASDGSMSTTSTPSNMPTVAMDNVTTLNMAPSGELLAVAGTNGLQIFRFNGAAPISRYSGLFTKSEVDAIFWDNANHLYAIGSKIGKLRVFTLTLTGYSHAPGSPYNINKPQGLRVLPL